MRGVFRGSDIQWRRNHARSVEEGEDQITLLLKPMALDIAASIRASAGDDGKIREHSRPRILAEVDRALNRVYPPRRGESSPLEAAIVMQTDTAISRSIELGLGSLFRRIEEREPDLSEALDAVIRRPD
jgi:hypothetical protein